MAVTVEPISGSVRLRVAGAIEAALSVPYDDDDRFLDGFSDGKLLQGNYDENLRSRWKVASERACLIRFRGGSVELTGHAEWVAGSLAPLLLKAVFGNRSVPSQSYPPDHSVARQFLVLEEMATNSPATPDQVRTLWTVRGGRYRSSSRSGVKPRAHSSQARTLS